MDWRFQPDWAHHSCETDSCIRCRGIEATVTDSSEQSNNHGSCQKQMILPLPSFHRIPRRIMSMCWSKALQIVDTGWFDLGLHNPCQPPYLVRKMEELIISGNLRRCHPNLTSKERLTFCNRGNPKPQVVWVSKWLAN